MEKLEIRVIVKELKTKEGKPFNVFKGVMKNGKLADLRFRRSVNKLPTKECIMVVDKKNIQKEKNTIYNTYWVKEVEEYKDLEPIEIDDEELPF